MIHELRTYTLQPGAQAKYLQLSGEVGRKIRGDRFGKQEGFWFTEFGTLNQLRASLELSRPQRAGAAAGPPGQGRCVEQGVHPAGPAPDAGAGEQDHVAGAAARIPPAIPAGSTSCAGIAPHVGRAKEWLDHFTAVMPTREKHHASGRPLADRDRAAQRGRAHVGVPRPPGACGGPRAARQGAGVAGFSRQSPSPASLTCRPSCSCPPRSPPCDERGGPAEVRGRGESGGHLEAPADGRQGRMTHHNGMS